MYNDIYTAGLLLATLIPTITLLDLGGFLLFVTVLIP